MFSRFFNKHKKLCIISVSIVALFLIVLYVYTASLPGIWHRDTFLYREDNGSFKGNNAHSEYEMNISPLSDGAEVTFRVNDTLRSYRIVSDEYGRNVEIFEDGISVFKGQASGRGDDVILIDEGEGFVDFTVTMTTNDDFFTVPEDSEQFPSYTSLYRRAIKQVTDTRGNFLMMLLAAITAVLLIVDLRYPDLFFHLKYMWHVDGGSPSEFYRFGQKLGRIIDAVLIVGLIIATYIVH